MNGAQRQAAAANTAEAIFAARTGSAAGPPRRRASRGWRSSAYIVEAEFSIELKELITAPASAASSTPRSAGGSSSRTSTGYAWSGWAIRSPYNCTARIPGRQIRKGTRILSQAATRIPRCPSARLRAASVRWVMNWLTPQ